MCLMGYLNLWVSIGSRRPLLVFLTYTPLWYYIIPCKVTQIRVCLLGRLVPFCFFLFFAPFGLPMIIILQTYSTFILVGARTRLRDKVPAARFMILGMRFVLLYIYRLQNVNLLYTRVSKWDINISTERL